MVQHFRGADCMWLRQCHFPLSELYQVLWTVCPTPWGLAQVVNQLADFCRTFAECQFVPSMCAVLLCPCIPLESLLPLQSAWRGSGFPGAFSWSISGHRSRPHLLRPCFDALIPYSSPADTLRKVNPHACQRSGCSDLLPWQKYTLVFHTPNQWILCN